MWLDSVEGGARGMNDSEVRFIVVDGLACADMLQGGRKRAALTIG